MSLVPDFSMPPSNRQVLLVRRPMGIPQASDFALHDGPIPPDAPGTVLVRNLYLSVDPAQRGWACDIANYAPPVPLGSPMRSLGVGQVIASDGIDDLPVGMFVYGWVGWQTYARLTAADVLTRIDAVEIPLSAYAGVAGINGMAARLGLNQLGQPAAGETVLVSTAAGAVGSIVGQLARAAGCRTIGLTGDDAKAAACRDRFGYDEALNYRRTDLADALAAATDGGVDVFFDNVGGALLDRGVRRMNRGGRIVQCGTASIAAWSPPPVGLRNEREIMLRRLSWHGFVIFDHLARFDDEARTLAGLVRSGALTHDEDIVISLDRAPDALRALYAGENRGKSLIFLA